MAEFVLAPNAPAADDKQKTALLFFSQQLLTEEQADLEQRFETITQGALQIPFFVMDRSQTFEHKQKRSGPGAHSHMKECMVEELDTFLSSDLPKDAIKKQTLIELGMEDSSATADVPKHRATPSTERYLKCRKEETGLHFEACFVHLPSWDQSSLQVHHVSLNVRKKEKSFWSREETLEIDGKRSVMTFNMVRSTVIQVLSALKDQGRDVEKEAGEFYRKVNLYDSRSIGNASSAKPLPESKSDPMQEHKQAKVSGSTKGNAHGSQKEPTKGPRHGSTEGDTYENQRKRRQM